jgi:hypothetical protein
MTGNKHKHETSKIKEHKYMTSKKYNTSTTCEKSPSEADNLQRIHNMKLHNQYK